MKKLAILYCIALLFQGCTYAISRDIAAQADNTISFKMLQDNPEAFAGKLLVLGGTIDQTLQTKQGTLIEIIQKPLDYWGKPKRTDRSGGRFLLLSSRRLDALVYAPGRQITVAAEVEGTRSSAPNETDFSYPMLHVRELKLWEAERRASDAPQWTDPLYDPNTSRHDW